MGWAMIGQLATRMLPWYDKVDQLIGVFGSKENPCQTIRTVFFFRHQSHGCTNNKEMEHRRQVPVIPSRLSILTKALSNNKTVVPFSVHNVTRGFAKVYGDFFFLICLVNPAVNTKHVDVPDTNTMAREVVVDETGKTTGVSYVDKNDMQRYVVNARVVILAASACESARLLLNSKSAKHPNGLKPIPVMLLENIYTIQPADMGGVFPNLVVQALQWRWGWRHARVFAWWLDNKKLDFPRGYHIEYYGGMGMPGYGFGGGMHNTNAKFAGRDGVKRAGGYGAALKDDYRYFYGATFGMSGRGKLLPRTTIEIDPNTVDKFGIPVLRFHYKWSDYEVKQAKHMKETFKEIIEKSGGIVTGQYQQPNTRWLWIGCSWPNHTQIRNNPHGRWSKKIGAQQNSIKPTIAKPICCRWR